MPYPGTAALLPMLGTVLVIGAGCATPTQGCGPVLAWSPMRALGRMSYSWYLWHWPVLVLAPALLGQPLGLAGKLVAVLFSGALAALTLRFVENPLRYAAPLRRSPRASLAVGALATAIAVCVGIAALVWVPAPVGRSLATQTLTITEGPPLIGGTVDQYNAVVRRDFAQVQAAVAASADLDDVPSNLDPPLADANRKSEADRTPTACMRQYPPGRTTPVRDGRHLLADHRSRDRRLECLDVDYGVPAGRRTAALAAGDAGQGYLPRTRPAHHHLRQGVHRVRPVAQ